MCHVNTTMNLFTCSLHKHDHIIQSPKPNWWLIPPLLMSLSYTIFHHMQQYLCDDNSTQHN